MEEICIVCRDVFDEPVICADGFCYCRRCIARWVDGDEVWRSPRSNVLHRGPCLLTPDVDRGARALEARRLRVEDDVGQACSLVYGGELAASAAQCAALLPRAVLSGEPWQALTLAARAGLLEHLPGEICEALLERDRAGPGPLLTFGVLSRVVRLLVARFRHRPGDAHLRAARAAVRHLSARAGVADAVVVPAHRAPGFQGVYVRDVEEPPGAVAFVAEAGRLLVPLRGWKEVCCTEAPPQTTLAPHGSQEGFAFGSQTRAALPSARSLWRERRKDALPFPDSCGDSDEEEWEAPPQLFEAALRHLPFDFEYLPRAPRPGAQALLMEHHDLLLQGFFRRTRPRTR